jgi:hypothetical protein
MRKPAFGVLLLALVAIPLATGAATRGAAAPVPAAAAPLQAATSQLAGWSYSLKALTSCEVGDGLAVVKDVGPGTLRITRVSLLVTGDVAGVTGWRFELVRFRAGSTTGEVAGSFTLAALRHGYPIGPAINGVLAPVGTSGSWYVVVARLRVPGGSASGSEIRGIDISYESGSHTFIARLTQSVHLPAFSPCR